MNPNLDEFEQRLAGCRLRPVPDDVPGDVLRALRRERQRLDETATRRANVSSSPWNALGFWLQGISPAWRVLGAVWVVGVSLNALCQTSMPGNSGRSVTLSPEQIAAERAVRLEMMVLAGLREPDPQPAEPPRVVPPRPRSSLKVMQRPNFG